MEFAGRVIDGPQRGRLFAHPAPFFYIDVLEPMKLQRWDRDKGAFEQPIEPKRLEYRWSYSLGEWALVY